MFDFTFIDAGFSATSIEVRPVSDKGREFFEKHFGRAACGATLRKSGGYEMMQAVDDAGMTYEVLEIAQ